MAKANVSASATLPSLLRDAKATLSPAAVQELLAYTDAQAHVTVDPRDSMHDRLFAIIMARVDAMQPHRAAYLTVIERLQRQLPLWPVLLRCAGKSAAAMLEDAGLLVDDARRHAQVAGLLATTAATLQAWKNDTSTDLSATLRACDTNLRRGATAAAWLGFA